MKKLFAILKDVVDYTLLPLKEKKVNVAIRAIVIDSEYKIAGLNEKIEITLKELCNGKESSKIEDCLLYLQKIEEEENKIKNIEKLKQILNKEV